MTQIFNGVSEKRSLLIKRISSEIMLRNKNSKTKNKKFKQKKSQ